MSEHRLYSFVNMYLSGIHAGIQTAHMIGEMALRYHRHAFVGSVDFETWLRNGKTIIVLNGGTSQNLEEIASKLFSLGAELSLPVAEFRESEEALEGMRTCVGIVVPKSVYLHGDPRLGASGSEVDLFSIIASCRLAT